MAVASVADRPPPTADKALCQRAAVAEAPRKAPARRGRPVAGASGAGRALARQIADHREPAASAWPRATPLGHAGQRFVGHHVGG